MDGTNDERRFLPSPLGERFVDRFHGESNDVAEMNRILQDAFAMESANLQQTLREEKEAANLGRKPSDEGFTIKDGFVPDMDAKSREREERVAEVAHHIERDREGAPPPDQKIAALARRVAALRDPAAAADLVAEHFRQECGALMVALQHKYGDASVSVVDGNLVVTIGVVAAKEDP